MKATTCINGPNDDVIQPKNSTKLDWEVELGVVIGTQAQYVERGRCARTTSPAMHRQRRLRARLPDGDHASGTRARASTPRARSARGSSPPTRSPIRRTLDMLARRERQAMQSGNTRTMVFDVREDHLAREPLHDAAAGRHHRHRHAAGRRPRHEADAGVPQAGRRDDARASRASASRSRRSSPTRPSSYCGAARSRRGVSWRMNKRADSKEMSVQALEQSAFWMPFTANRQFKQAPRLLARAEGMYYWTPEGRQILDGCAGLWCVNAGHCRPKIVEAIAEQAATMDFAPTFQMGHPIAFEFAERLAAIAPEGFTRVFFTNSGSESVDTALKIALAYHRARGEGAAHPPDRPRARLSRRELRRHGGRRHRRQPQDVRARRRRRRSHPPHARPRAERVLARPAGVRRASSPTSWSACARCTTRRPSPR